MRRVNWIVLLVVMLAGCMTAQRQWVGFQGAAVPKRTGMNGAIPPCMDGTPAVVALPRAPVSAPLVYETVCPDTSCELPKAPNIPGVASEEYDGVDENPFRLTANPGNDASTFSVDVDTASYANVRRLLTMNGMPPPPGAVRIEELVNYFEYDDAPPANDAPHPFAIHTEVGACPWAPAHRLVRIGLKGKTMQPAARPASNLVFLIDVSGSMQAPQKLTLVKQGLTLLTEQLGETDRIAIVVYAGSSGLVLPSTSCSDRRRILRALKRLTAGGSTNGGEGIKLAYQVAREHRLAGGNNRVILCTDGDFNVGISDRSRLLDLVAREAGDGIDLTVLGFGMGNYKDGTMEALSNRGNGNYFYIDGEREARKVLVEEMTGTLVTIARDVKAQVFFNPARVGAWRLIGYENRRLNREDFNDDTKDAGDIGAGHAVVALYEIVPAGAALPGRASDPNPYLEPRHTSAAARGDHLLRLRIRYKRPGERVSILQETDVAGEALALPETSRDFRWAAAVAGFGMLLRKSPHAGALDWDMVRALAGGARGVDRHGFRKEFMGLVDTARAHIAAGDETFRPASETSVCRRR